MSPLSESVRHSHLFSDNLKIGLSPTDPIRTVRFLLAFGSAGTTAKVRVVSISADETLAGDSGGADKSPIFHFDALTLVISKAASTAVLTVSSFGVSVLLMLAVRWLPNSCVALLEPKEECFKPAVIENQRTWKSYSLES